MVQNEPQDVVWIYRNRSGQVRVFPSPAHVQGGQSVTFKNLTDGAAVVRLVFQDDRDVSVPARGSETVMITVSGPRFVEYELTLDGHHAEGGSPPGFIIDP